MWRQPGEPLNPNRLGVAEIEALKARIAPHVFASQYQQRPATGGTGSRCWSSSTPWAAVSTGRLSAG